MADYSNQNRGQEDDEDEEDIDETGYKTIKDAVLFAIDVSSTMLMKPPQGDSKKADRDTPTIAALKCAYSLMQQRIISNPNDMMGILLFGTEKSRFQDEEGTSKGLSYPHCYLLTNLDVPGARDIKRLRDLVNDEDEAKELLQPSTESVSMSNVLFCANQIFTTKAPNFSSRRLFLVTDNDAPHNDDKALRSAAAVRAKDLYDLGVTIELFPISSPEHTFDRSIFYNDIIYSAIPSDPDAPAPVTKTSRASASGDGLTLLQSLLSNINSRSAPRRALFSNMPFEIGPGLKISIKGYIIIKRQEPARSSYVYMGGERPQLAVGSSTLQAEDTARSVEKVEIRKAYKFGGETVSFTPEEIAEVKHFGDPVLRIIGFKPLSMLPIWANHRPSTFIYPSEEDVIGSTRVFSALQHKLLKDQKMGLAWYIPRRNATPTLAAVIPGAESLDEDGVQVMPPGLWIHVLPFADDVRQVPDTTVVQAPDELVDKMRTIVQQLQLPKAVYDPKKYPNPSLQWFYRILQALALDEDLPEKPEDKTLPRYRQIDKRAGEYVIEWGSELETQYEAWKKANAGRHTATGATKRGSTTAGESGKRAKPAANGTASKSSDSISDEDMRKAFETNKINKLTVAVLKAWCKEKGVKLAATAKKGDVVDEVTSYFENKMNLS
ncbi:ATP-dependent DNA helicase-like protein II subunit 1 [Aureobasidium pullulans]|nr:ATP-dependent DNA helicase-like protein II subunit 1 [Aureobasidium pullulans]